MRWSRNQRNRGKSRSSLACMGVATGGMMPRICKVFSLVIGYHRLDFDFHEHLGGHQTAHLHHRASRAHAGKEFTMGSANFLPIVNIGHKNASPDHVLEARSQALQGTVDVSDD